MALDHEARIIIALMLNAPARYRADNEPVVLYLAPTWRHCVKGADSSIYHSQF